MDISIIIPIHNAEKYLSRCLESVIRAVSHFRGKAEIILVDNQSSDKSLQIAKNFQKKHLKLVRVLQCNTRGASPTRNLGVESARGEYIWFIDADDEIASKAISSLIGVAKREEADLVMMSAERRFLDGSTARLEALDPSDPEFKSRFIRYGMGPWQVLIRRAWWTRHNFEFRVGIIHEDMELMPALVLYADRVASVPDVLYYYYETPGSVLHKQGWDPHYLDIFPALSGLYGRFEKAGAVLPYRDELEWFFIWNLLVDSAKDFAKAPEGRVGFQHSRQMLRQYFPHWRQNRFLNQRKISWKFRLKIKLSYCGIISQGE